MAAIKGCFIKINNVYCEISYEQHLQLQQTDSDYAKRKFIPTSGYLLEVPEDEYTRYQKEKRRSRYLAAAESGVKVFSFHHYEDSRPLEETIEDPDIDIESSTIHKLQLEELQNAMKLLTVSELYLYKALYVEGLTIKEYAEAIGVREHVVAHDKKRMIEKLRQYYNQKQ